MKKIGLIFVLPLFLIGCTANIALIDRTNGNYYKGKTIGAALGGNGELQVNVDGLDYKGTWTYSAMGGSYSIGSATTSVYGGGVYASGNSFGNSLNMSAQGKGLINMKADNGSFIRCVFDFNEWSGSGIGECQRNDGRLFDLTVKK